MDAIPAMKIIREYITHDLKEAHDLFKSVEGDTAVGMPDTREA